MPTTYAFTTEDADKARQIIDILAGETAKASKPKATPKDAPQTVSAVAPEPAPFVAPVQEAPVVTTVPTAEPIVQPAKLEEAVTPPPPPAALPPPVATPAPPAPVAAAAPPPAAVVEQPLPGWSFDEHIRPRCAGYVAKHSAAELNAYLTENFGVKLGKDIPPSRWPEFVSKIDVLLAS